MAECAHEALVGAKGVIMYRMNLTARVKCEEDSLRLIVFYTSQQRSTDFILVLSGRLSLIATSEHPLCLPKNDQEQAVDEAQSVQRLVEGTENDILLGGSRAAT